MKFEDRPVPDVEDSHDVVISVKYTGICGSDVCISFRSSPPSAFRHADQVNSHPQVHYWEHGGIGDFILTSPMVLGHESAGVVHKVGSAVSSLQVGDRVALEPGIPCRLCEYCKAGKYNLCAKVKFAATPPHDGTLARYYVLPEDYCYKLPEQMSLEEGALMEPLSVGVHIAKQGEVRPGNAVVVLGCGPIGLCCCAVAKAFGASKVIVIDIQQSRLDFALEYGYATHAYHPAVDLDASANAGVVREKFQLGRGADVVLEASGAQPCIHMGIQIVRNGGFYVQGGMGKDVIPFPIMAVCSKEATLRGCFRYGPGDYALSRDLTATGRIDVKSLITHKVKFEDAEKAFKDVKAGQGIKTLIAGPDVPV